MRPTSPAAVRRMLAVACALLAALALAACGSDSSAIPGQKDETSGSGQPASTPAQAESETVRPAKAMGGAVPCRAQLGEFVSALDRLRTRLAAGLSYPQYTAAVKRIRATYDGLPTESLPPGCLISAGAPGENAFNRYIEAANAWGECLADAGCNAEVVEPELQREWQVASHWLSVASKGLG